MGEGLSQMDSSIDDLGQGALPDLRVTPPHPVLFQSVLLCSHASTMTSSAPHLADYQPSVHPSIHLPVHLLYTVAVVGGEQCDCGIRRDHLWGGRMVLVPPSEKFG